MEILSLILVMCLVALFVAFTVGVGYFTWFVCGLLKMAKDEIESDALLDKQNACDHLDKHYNDGHPDFPFKCNKCDKQV